MTVSGLARRAMGTTVTVAVNGGRLDAAGVIAEIDRLERCWSRFLPGSELNRMNDRAGDLTVVSPTLLVLVQHLVTAHRLSGGRFDPTLGGRIAALGYDRTYRTLQDDPTPDHRRDRPSSPLPLGGEVVVIPGTSAVIVPTGTRLDPGGLGKGLAADIAAAAAIEAGAEGVIVDLGGDIVTRGVAPGGGLWRIDVPAAGGRPRQMVELHDGAVATSDSGARTWTVAGVLRRHILEPATGRPLDRDLRATVVAGAGWWAEAVATAAIISLDRHDGWIHTLGASEGISSVDVYETDGVHA